MMRKLPTVLAHTRKLLMDFLNPTYPSSEPLEESLNHPVDICRLNGGWGPAGINAPNKECLIFNFHIDRTPAGKFLLSIISRDKSLYTDYEFDTIIEAMEVAEEDWGVKISTWKKSPPKTIG